MTSMKPTIRSILVSFFSQFYWSLALFNILPKHINININNIIKFGGKEIKPLECLTKDIYSQLKEN